MELDFRIQHFCLKSARLIALPLLGLLAFHSPTFSQSMYLPQDNKHLQFLQRLEIMLQKNPDLNIASPKTLSRHIAVFTAGMEDSSSGNPQIKLSKVDQQNLQSLLRNNAEWSTLDFKHRKTIYRNPTNLVEVNKENFFFALNPMVYAEYSYDNNNSRSIYHYAGGGGFRSVVGKKLGFYGFAVKHAESPPNFVREWITNYNAVPGAGKLDNYKDAYLYWDARGGITLKALKFFDFQIAYDRNFIGNGYRSLFLSDFAKNYVFGKATTRVWKFQYTHIYAPLIPQFDNTRAANWPVGKRVTAFHHLSFNATKWLNLGVFQSVSIARRGDWLYMMPVIFYPVSSFKESKPENNLGGFEFKLNIAKKHQIYGQVLIDNINSKQLSKGNGWWNNRFAGQIGAKTINMFGISNLDLQVEMNAVRPYTYSEDSLGSYTHYNQPLSHPLGANFIEGIGIVKYQPYKRIALMLRIIKWAQGIDTSRSNFGTNIRLNPGTRPNEFGYTIPTGIGSKNLNTSLIVAYEPIENLHIESSFLYRRASVETFPKKDTFLGSITIRLNLSTREYPY